MIDLIMGENRDRDLPYWIKIANNEPVDWDEVFDPWEATVDWPAASRWEQLVDHFSDVPRAAPNLRLDGFYKSCQNTILAVKLAAGPSPSRTPTARALRPSCGGVIEKLIWQGRLPGQVRGQGVVPPDVLRPDREDQEEGPVPTA